MKKNFVIIILILVLIFVLYNSINEKPADVVEEDTPEVIVDGPDEVEDEENNFPSISVNEETELYVIDVKYPEVSNQKVQESIKEVADRQIAIFKKIFEDDPDYEIFGGRKNLLLITFKATNSEDFDSFIFYITTDTGGAHPNSVVETATYSKDGEKVDIETLFKKYNETTDGLGFELETIVTEDIESQLESEDYSGWVEDAITSDLDSFKNFFVRDDKVVFIYSPYEVGPYALGFVEVSLPLEIYER